MKAPTVLPIYGFHDRAATMMYPPPTTTGTYIVPQPIGPQQLLSTVVSQVVGCEVL